MVLLTDEIIGVLLLIIRPRETAGYLRTGFSERPAMQHI
jgi:hypothetical protein